MDHGQIPEACRAFAESQRLDPAGGTLLRLALCHEKQGKVASAAFEFREVVRLSKGVPGDPAKLAERIRLAQEHLTAVEPRVPKLVVSVPDGSRPAGLSINVNGATRAEGTWGVAIATDPGDVPVAATAPSRLPFHTTVHLGEGELKTLNIPALEAEPVAVREPIRKDPVVEPVSHSSTQRTVAIVVGIVGVGALGVGSYFGAKAISDWGSAHDICPTSSFCNPAGISDANSASSAASLSNVTLTIGAVAVVAAVVLWVTGAPKNVTVTTGSVGVRF